MSLNANSIAAGVGSSVKNKAFQPQATAIPRKILIVGTADPLKTELSKLVPILVTSPEDVASKVGNGFMLHRLAIAAFKGSGGVETYIMAQDEAGGAAKSAGNILFTGPATAAGTLFLYIGGELVSVNIANGTSADDIATAVAAAINADSDVAVTAVVNGVTTSQVDITAKSSGPFGDEIDLSLNLGFGEEKPAGVDVTITALTGGAGIPDIDAVLTALGTGDNANEDFYTELAHGYGQDSSTLDKISAYVGEGNDFVGLYSKTVHRPFRSLVGDVDPGSGALTSLISLSDSRKLDRANGVIPAPGSETPESEIAAQALGIMARIANNRPEETYTNQVLDIQPGANKADRWNADYSNRDTAARAGVGTTVVKSGIVYMQDTLTFYHPDNVSIKNNGYRSMRNISILQNILDNIAKNFSSERWQGTSIVADISEVATAVSKEKARDAQSVINDLVALAQSFASLAWIYESEFTIENLSVSPRDPLVGFDSVFPIILSGEGAIFDTVTEFDTSIAILN